MTSIIHMAATLFPTGPRSRKKSGTPISAPPPKQEEKRYADQRTAAEADKLPLG